MKISKYRLTTAGREGSAILVYENGYFKSLLNEFKPCLNDSALNYILNLIPADEASINDILVNRLTAKSKLEKLGDDAVLPVNQAIALFCDYYQAKTKVQYRVSKADAGKMSVLKQKGTEWQKIFQVYFDSQDFLFKNKWSISNLVKYWNELRLEVYGTKSVPTRNYPIPYSHAFFLELDVNEQREYWKHLRMNGYEFKGSGVRGGEWVKKEGLKL